MLKPDGELILELFVVQTNGLQSTFTILMKSMLVILRDRSVVYLVGAVAAPRKWLSIFHRQNFPAKCYKSGACSAHRNTSELIIKYHELNSSKTLGFKTMSVIFFSFWKVETCAESKKYVSIMDRLVCFTLLDEKLFRNQKLES